MHDHLNGEHEVHNGHGRAWLECREYAGVALFALGLYEAAEGVLLLEVLEEDNTGAKVAKHHSECAGANVKVEHLHAYYVAQDVYDRCDHVGYEYEAGVVVVGKNVVTGKKEDDGNRAQQEHSEVFPREGEVFGRRAKESQERVVKDEHCDAYDDRRNYRGYDGSCKNARRRVLVARTGAFGNGYAASYANQASYGAKDEVYGLDGAERREGHFPEAGRDANAANYGRDLPEHQADDGGNHVVEAALANELVFVEVVYCASYRFHCVDLASLFACDATVF